jgi:hypothetical protein
MERLAGMTLAELARRSGAVVDARGAGAGCLLAAARCRGIALVEVLLAALAVTTGLGLALRGLADTVEARLRQQDAFPVLKA